MKLGFSHFFDLLSAEVQVTVDIDVEWENGFPHLVINDVLDSTGKVSFLGNKDKLMEDIGFRIASLAEDDERLLEKAVEQYVFERAA
jgi:hypothetical protein